jgi:hypothetical protein
MNIGIGEMIILVISAALLVGIPLVIVVAGLFLSRRIHALESRIEQLESRQGTSSDKTS